MATVNGSTDERITAFVSDAQKSGVDAWWNTEEFFLTLPKCSRWLTRIIHVDDWEETRQRHAFVKGTCVGVCIASIVMSLAGSVI